MNLQNRRLTDLEMDWWLLEEGIVREFGMDTYIRLYLKWIASKDLLHSTGNTAQCYVSVWMGAGFGGECIHAYIWLGPSQFTWNYHSTVNWLYPNTKLEKEMAAHSSVLAWRIPGMGEPGGLPSMRLHRVGHDWSDLAAAAAIQNKKLK